MQNIHRKQCTQTSFFVSFAVLHLHSYPIPIPIPISMFCNPTNQRRSKGQDHQMSTQITPRFDLEGRGHNQRHTNGDRSQQIAHRQDRCDHHRGLPAVFQTPPSRHGRIYQDAFMFVTENPTLAGNSPSLSTTSKQQILPTTTWIFRQKMNTHFKYLQVSMEVSNMQTRLRI
jgi:hypothetical protein